MTGEDSLLPGVKEFWNNIPKNDFIIITTGREEIYIEKSLQFLKDQGLRFNHAIFGIPRGERILINDIKPSGLDTAIGINVERNAGVSNIKINLDDTL